MGGITSVFKSIFKGVSKSVKKKKPKSAAIVEKPLQAATRAQQQTSARLGSTYGAASTLLGGASGVTEQAKTSRTLLGS
jgi:hypothetical protein